MTKKSFSNKVGKALGWTKGGPVVAQDKITRAHLGGNAYIETEIDGGFEIFHLKDWQAVQLLEAGFVATVKIRQPRWAKDPKKAVMVWSVA
jgi:hypothetical protein